MSPIDFLSDLTDPDLAFLPKALLVALLAAIICGAVGCHVVLRGMSFVGDAIAHAVFPGLAVAFVFGTSLVVGGALAGVITAILIACFSQVRRLKEDAVIGVLMVAAFALGIVVMSRARGYGGSLQEFLFGSITAIPDGDLVVIAIATAGIVSLLIGFNRALMTVALDRETARALGLPVFWLDLGLYVLTAIAVVLSVRTIGNILVLGLLIIPAATARLLTDRLATMLLLAPLLGVIGAFAGVYASWSWDLPTGATIVLALAVLFVAASLLRSAPRRADRQPHTRAVGKRC